MFEPLFFQNILLYQCIMFEYISLFSVYLNVCYLKLLLLKVTFLGPKIYLKISVVRDNFDFEMSRDMLPLGENLASFWLEIKYILACDIIYRDFNKNHL